MSFARIIYSDLQLKCVKKRRAHELTDANCVTRMDRAQKLLRKFPSHLVPFIFFTDEKVFTVAAPTNPQNDRLYTPRNIRKRDIEAGRLLRTRPTFSKSVMVSVAVSKLGCTDLIFVEPGVKVNITGMFCCHKGCCPRFVNLPANFTFLCKTVPRLIVRVTLSSI